MDVLPLDFMGSPNIGVYMLATDSYVIVPVKTPETTIEKIGKCLSEEVICTNIGGSRIIGVLATANSNGMLLPHYVYDDEIRAIRSATDVNVERIVCKSTAFGNLVLANDHGAIVDPQLMRKNGVAKKIEDVLSVEVVQGEIAGLPYVGSIAVVTNKGALAHPMLEDEEREVLKGVLKVPVDVGTVNRGIPFVASGLVANEHGSIVGSVTTGPEIFIISNLFGQ